MIVANENLNFRDGRDFEMVVVLSQVISVVCDFCNDIEKIV